MPPPRQRTIALGAGVAGALVVTLLAAGACGLPGTGPGAPEIATAPVGPRFAFSDDTLAWADLLLTQPAPVLPAPAPPAPAPPAPAPPAPAPPIPAALAARDMVTVPDVSAEVPAIERVVDAITAVPALPIPAASAPRPRQWAVATLPSLLFRASFGAEVIDRVSVGTYFRLEAGNQDDRYYVVRAADGERGWVPARGLASWPEPSYEDINARTMFSDPRQYLYWRWPQTARRMDCVIRFESGWNPRALNRSSAAAGLAQFIPSTWARTPHGRAGFSPYDPYAAIDAFGWMVVQGGGSWGEWEVVYLGLC